MTRAAAVFVMALTGAVHPAAAQTDAPADPLTITVRPSGVEDEGATARERLERLIQRREQDAFRLRWICTHCMGQDVNKPRQQLGAGD